MSQNEGTFTTSTNLLNRDQALPKSIRTPSVGYNSGSFKSPLSFNNNGLISPNTKFRELQQYTTISGIFQPNNSITSINTLENRNAHFNYRNLTLKSPLDSSLNNPFIVSSRITPDYLRKKSSKKTFSDVNMKPNIFLRNQTARRDSSLSPVRCSDSKNSRLDISEPYFSSVGNLTPTAVSNQCSRSTSRSSIISPTEERMQFLNKTRQMNFQMNSKSVLESHINFNDQVIGKVKTRFQLRSHMDPLSKKKEDVQTGLYFSDVCAYDFRPQEKRKDDNNSKMNCDKTTDLPANERNEILNGISSLSIEENNNVTQNKNNKITDIDEQSLKQKNSNLDSILHETNFSNESISPTLSSKSLNLTVSGDGDTLKQSTIFDDKIWDDTSMLNQASCDCVNSGEEGKLSDEADENISVCEDDSNNHDDYSSDSNPTCSSDSSTDDSTTDSSVSLPKTRDQILEPNINEKGDTIKKMESPMSSKKADSTGETTQRAKSLPAPILAALPLVTFSYNLPSTPHGFMPPFLYSLFEHVPPVLHFVEEGEKVQNLPSDLRVYLKWRTSTITPIVIRHSLSRSHFKSSKLSSCTDDLDSLETHDWIFYFGRHMKLNTFKAIKEYQKVNHFPSSFQIGRKDRLWRNLHKLQTTFGSEEFNFFPLTFCLPSDFKLLKRNWDEGGHKIKWILKPPAAARGSGIKVINKWNQIPKKRAVIVQKYICEPYLINDSKFDLRLYVYVSSMEPLKLYLHEEGLVRFASQKYNQSAKFLNNRFIHLTNYSINKLSNDYTDNTDRNACRGHKWSLSALWMYLEDQNVDTEQIWDNIKDIIIKTVISSESFIFSAMKQMCKSKYSVNELFGFDILLDKNLNPWILEVNISPSLHSNSVLDTKIKGSMVKDMLNLSGIQLPDPEDILAPLKDREINWNSYQPSSDLIMDRRLRCNTLTPEDKKKHVDFNYSGHKTFNLSILDDLTPLDVRNLIHFVDEQERVGGFELIFPMVESQKYLRYFEQPRYYNYLMIAYLTRYQRDPSRGIKMLQEHCRRKYHLKVSDCHSES